MLLLKSSCLDFGGSVSASEITKFIDGGGNVLVGASSDIGKPFYKLKVSSGCRELVLQSVLFW